MSALLKARLNRDRLARETLSIITDWLDYECAEETVERIVMQGEYCVSDMHKIRHRLVERGHPVYLETVNKFEEAAKAVAKLERELASAEGVRWCHCGREVPV